MGIKEKWPQSYLSYFSTGFPWRIFLLSRANRLYSILRWLEEPGVPRVSDILLSSTRNTGFGPSARYEPCSKTNFLTIYFRWRGALPFWGPSQSFGFSLPPLPVSGDLRLLSTNTCWYPLSDPHSLLTVTFFFFFFFFFFTGFHCSFQREDSINLTSIVSAGYHVTICRKCAFHGSLFSSWLEELFNTSLYTRITWIV